MNKRPSSATDVAKSLQKIASGAKIFRQEKRDTLKALSDLYFMAIITAGNDLDSPGPDRLLSVAAKMFESGKEAINEEWFDSDKSSVTITEMIETAKGLILSPLMTDENIYALSSGLNMAIALRDSMDIPADFQALVLPEVVALAKTIATKRQIERDKP